jgi:hypothetical protein
MMNASRRLGISVLAMLGLLAACGGRRGPDKPAPSSLTVTVVRPSMQEIERELVKLQDESLVSCQRDRLQGTNRFYITTQGKILIAR